MTPRGVSAIYRYIPQLRDDETPNLSGRGKFDGGSWRLWNVCPNNSFEPIMKTTLGWLQNASKKNIKTSYRNGEINDIRPTSFQPEPRYGMFAECGASAEQAKLSGVSLKFVEIRNSVTEIPKFTVQKKYFICHENLRASVS